MRQLLPVIAVALFATSAFAANHQGQRYANVSRAQAQAGQTQPYALTGAEQSKVIVERRDAQPRPVR